MAALWRLALIWIICGGVVGWAWAGVKLLRGEALVPWQPRREVPWALLDLLVVIGANFLAAVLVATALVQLGWRLEATGAAPGPGDLKMQTLANCLIPILGMGAGLAFVVFHTGASAHDLGWSPEHLRADLKLGLTAFVMLAPPVFAVQAVLVQFWESKHPLMEMFKNAPQDEVLFGLLVLTAVVVAPVFEELLFRVLLQGYLEKAFWGRRSAQELVLGERRRTARGQESGVRSRGSECSVQSLVHDAAELSILAELVEEDSAPLRGWSAWLPIAISSLVFALLHWQHGPDWVPLTLLAAGMGYVYQRTHRILPSVVVHVALNGMSMWGLWVQGQSGF
jgi:membrane protease YdiL (CAAX protease family)